MPTFDCPTCRKSFTVEHVEDAPLRPFCSHRCKMVDLGRWLDGTYTIRGDEPAAEMDDPDPDRDPDRDSA